jgi:hypothetical protein
MSESFMIAVLSIQSFSLSCHFLADRCVHKGLLVIDLWSEKMKLVRMGESCRSDDFIWFLLAVKYIRVCRV